MSPRKYVIGFWICIFFMVLSLIFLVVSIITGHWWNVINFTLNALCFLLNSLVLRQLRRNDLIWKEIFKRHLK